MSRKLYDNTETLEEVLELLNNKAAGGGGENKLAGLVDGTVTEITAQDLAGVTSIRGHAFRLCGSLTSIEIPGSATSIGVSAFINCSKLKSVNIPNSVTSIGSAAFTYCVVLKSVNIPNGVTSIGDNTFGECYALKRVDFSKHTSVPSLSNANAFANAHADLQIKVPASLIDSWKEATNWNTYADKIVTEFTNTL